MRWPAILVFTFVAIAALQAALPVLVVLLVLAVLWGVYFRPGEMLGFIAMLVLAAAFKAHGLALIIVAAVLGFVAIVREPAVPKPPNIEPAKQPLLTSDSDKSP